jgi:hypothetical protein
LNKEPKNFCCRANRLAHPLSPLRGTGSKSVCFFFKKKRFLTSRALPSFTPD